MEKKTAERQITFEGGLAPSPALFEGERLLGTIEAGLWDIGLLGFLLKHKERLVVTNYRIFQFSRKLTSASLKSLELGKVESIFAGSKFSVLQFAVGLLFLLFAVILLGGAIFADSDFFIGSLASAVVGTLAVLTAGRKVLQVSAGGDKNSVTLPLRRIKMEESKSFVDLVSRAIRNLQKPATPAIAATNQAPAEMVNDSLNNVEDASDEIEASEVWVYPPPSSRRPLRHEGGGREKLMKPREFLR